MNKIKETHQTQPSPLSDIYALEYDLHNIEYLKNEKTTFLGGI